MLWVMCVNLCTRAGGPYPMMQWDMTSFLHPKKNQPGRSGEEGRHIPNPYFLIPSPVEWNRESERCSSYRKIVLLSLHYNIIKSPHNYNCSTRLQPVHEQRDTSQPEQFTQVCV